MEEWEDIEYKVELPVDGSQDDIYLKMGIEFGPFDERDVWRGANLPEGWSVVRRDRQSSLILDARKIPRAYFRTKKPIYLRPLRRFSYGKGEVIHYNTELRCCLWDDAVPFPEERKIVLEETFTVPDKQQHKETHDTRVGIYWDNFEKKALEWLNINYPDWENSESYWDVE